MPAIFDPDLSRQTGSPGNGSPIDVGLVQINNSFSGQCYLPYSVGLLQAHAQAHMRDASRVRFLPPIYRRMRVDEIVERLDRADLVLFSTYVWNERVSITAATRLKERNPSVRIAFGGPQVPDDPTELFVSNPCIDLVVHGEGEQVFLQLIESCDGREWSATPGISFRDGSGAVIRNPRGPRITNLDTIPSPYLSGVFEEIIGAAPDQKWIALWETNRGCPFSCTFCDWGSATAARVYQFGLERLFREVDWFAERGIEFVFCCDANFGIFKRDIEIVKYVADRKRSSGFPSALSVQNTKNATERTYLVQRELSEGGLNKGVTLSMQSLDETTLKYIKRDNISLQSYQELQRRFTRDRVETYGDLILALPGETYDSFVDGVAELIGNGQHNRIQFNNLAILPNAPMASPASRLEHGLVTVESDIINIHGSLADVEGEITERQQLVIATKSMPPEQWVRTRAFCWMTSLLHFDKLLQIPIILMRSLAGITYREIFECFSEGDSSQYPMIARVRQFFRQYAREIQNGGPEYVRSEQYLNIYWPADEFMLITLIAEREIGAFYDEALALLQSLLDRDHGHLVPVLEDAVRLNRELLKVPFQREDLQLVLRYSIWDYYQGVLMGSDVRLEEHPTTHAVDRTSVSWWTWDEYCREVIWYGNKKGAYLYTQPLVTPQIAGIY